MLRTILSRRVRNTTLPKSHALLPLLEAIVNGIQAIDARYGPRASSGSIRVVINRSSYEQQSLFESGQGRPPLKEIEGFTVSDDGVGFNSENMASFTTLDSDYKANLGCRGVGRLLWLKAFDRVEVSSVFKDEDQSCKSRSFVFTISQEIEELPAPPLEFDTGSIVQLIGFKEAYRRAAPKSVEAIARQVFEHCIWYFLREGGAPDIVISDNDSSFSLRDILDNEGYSSLVRKDLVIKGYEFSLLGI